MATKLNPSEALSFLDHIKLQFRNEPSKYTDFLSAMKDFKRHRIGNNEVVVRVCEVLNGYPSLVREFNSFLPHGYILEPSNPSEGLEPFITLNSPEGVSVYPRDYPLRGPSNTTSRYRKVQYEPSRNTFPAASSSKFIA